jgi:hypothetical protein
MMKKCSKCGEVKELASFHKLNSSKDGHKFESIKGESDETISINSK